ncbi:hypothetical protein [Thiohalorhabdus methylotrophus]|uniref:PHP domain-containing protein n=1 Tax=Thiohalorhabdus methylotrophus TaxID=3242694 RepID=A0ABV4TYB4_9GAMM
MRLNQDLHIHTTWSTGDASVVPEQTVDLVARVGHARIVGISDHFEHVAEVWDAYAQEVREAELRLGTEVNGAAWVETALGVKPDYYIYHCFDTDADYRGLERLLASDRPVIVAHPNALDTDLDRVPPEAYVELNNRYVWRCDWLEFYGPYRDRFSFVLSSDAHRPNWLGQSVARRAAEELEVGEILVWPMT